MPRPIFHIRCLRSFALQLCVPFGLKVRPTRTAVAKRQSNWILENWAGHFVTALGVAGLEDYNVRGVVM